MASSVQELISTVRTTAPLSLDGPVNSLAQRLSPGAAVEWVPIRPSELAQPQECFYNVKAMVERSGGELVYGWAIWEWPQVFIEAEHHAVWELDGHLVDVTPHEIVGDRVAFVRDPLATFDWSHATQRENVKVPLTDSPAVSNYLAATDAMRELMREGADGRTIRLDPMAVEDLVIRVTRAKLGVFEALASKTSPNAPCVCGSTVKFKRCCAGLFA
ncbi:SEC-C metal-binding domain-containing protein [Maricaulis salignorans]|uniref:SEC-C metal-binding domain-containing protein n=1 Tax=Maricaulis salignorans TaxID=144026 RepID=UPI003A94C473